MSEREKEVRLARESGKWKVVLDLQKQKEEREREENERRIAMYREAANKKGLTLEGSTADELQTSLCSQLATSLSLREKLRKIQVETNSILYGCEDPGPPVLPPHRYWDRRERVNAIDDSRDLIFSLRADLDDITSPTLLLRCTKRKLDVYFTTDAYVSDAQSLMVRRDKNPPQKWWGNEGAGGRSIFFSKPRNFLQSLAGVEQLVVQYRPYNKMPSELVFEIAGFDHVAEELKTACPF